MLVMYLMLFYELATSNSTGKIITGKKNKPTIQS